MRYLLPCSFFIIYAHAAATPVPVKIKVLEGRPVVDQVYLNGSGPYRFLLDTGAQSNQIDAKLARTIGLKTEFRVEMVTATGVIEAPGGHLAEVELGGSVARSQEFLVTNLAGVRQLSGGIQGVLGQEFLANFDYRIDFQHKTLVFGGEVPTGKRIRAKALEGRVMAIYTSLGELVLDSGTDALVLFREQRSPATGGISTASGFAAVSTAEGTSMMIEGDRYRAAMTAYAGRAARPEAGLLPASLFHSVYVCNSGGFVVIR